jgi:CRP-like cAMP-binding protein
MLSVLAKRNRLMLGHYVDLSFRTIPARLAKYLLEISKDGSEIILRSHHPIREMAAHIVAAPEAVSRTLKIFKSNKVIECDRSAIRVIDIENVRQIARIDI